MADPLPIITFGRHDADSSGKTFNTSETELGHATLSPTGRPPGSTLAVRLIAECSAVTGTATIRLRKDSISGTILATATITAAGTVVSATGSLSAPLTATRLVVTGQNSSGSSTIRVFTAYLTGDGTDSTFAALTGSSYTELSPWAGGLMVRDDTDRVWLLDRDSETIYSRDDLRRVFPQLYGAGHVRAKQVKPWVVLVGTDLWVFSLNSATPSLVPSTYDATAYELTVIDGVDFTVKFTSIVTAAITGNIFNQAAVYDGSNYVWFLYVIGDASIRCDRWDVNNVGGAPTRTTYRTVATATFQCIDATRLPHGEIAVVATSVSGHTLKADHSYLDTSTGAAKSSPAGVTTTATAITPSAICCGGISIFENQADSATSWRYAYWMSDPGDATKVDLLMKTVDGAALTVSSTATLESRFPTGSNDSTVVGWTCGARNDSDGAIYWWGALKDDASVSTTGYPYNQTINNGTVGVAGVTSYGNAWLASKPFQRAAGDWYVLTGYDDGEDTRAQRCLHVRKNGSTAVFAQIGYGEMGPAYFLAESDTTLYPIVMRQAPFVTPVVQVSGGKHAAGALSAGDTAASGQARVLALDWSATYSRGAVIPGNALVYPGGVPQVAGPRDDLHDLSPLLGPNLATTAALGAGAALGTFYTAYLYRFMDASGRVYRSPPSPVASHAFLDGGTRSLTVRNLAHIGRGTASIEIYASTATDTTPRLQHVVPNDPGSRTQTINVNPAQWSGQTEALYTTASNALENFPPPPCRNVATWRDRVYLSGTGVDGEVWYSQEAEDGVGVRLNPVLRANWGNGDGAIYGMAPVDWNYLAVFRSAGVAVISGPGADGSGSGGYAVQALTTRNGTTRPLSLVSGPAGAYFQNAGDGLIYLVTPGLQVVDVSRGAAANLASATVVAASHIVTASQLWFFCSDGTILVLDYRYPTSDQPAGQWYRWTSAGLDSYCVGCVEESDGSITWLQANKAMRRIQSAFTDTDSAAAEQAILMRLKTGKLAVAGAQGEVCIERIKLLGQHVGASTLRASVTPDSGSAETHDVTTSSPVDYIVHPGNCLRIQEIELTVEETASTTEGFVLDTVAIEFNPRGHNKRLPASKFV